MTTVLTETDQIRQWLDNHDGFTNATLAYTFDSAARELTLDIECRDEMALAGETEVLKIFSITISDVQGLSSEFTSDEHLTLYQVYPLQDTPGLVMDVWGKDQISFTCARILIGEAKEIERVSKPILSTTTLAFKIRTEEKPDSAYWIKRLQEKGYKAVYIGYFGNEKPTNEIVEYTGLSIRPMEENRPWPGVKFCKVVHTDGVLELIIELQNSELQNFWQDFLRTLSVMDVIEVRSGNVVLSANEWIDFLDTATLPERLR